MDTDRIYWIALGFYGLAFLLDGAIRAITNGLTLPNGGMIVGAVIVLIGGIRGLRSPESVHRGVPRSMRYLVIFGAFLSTLSVVLRYLL